MEKTETIVSEIFKRGTALTILPTEELVINEANIRKSLEKAIKREKDRGSKLQVWMNSDFLFWKPLEGVVMPEIIEQFTSRIYRLRQNVANKKIRTEADNLSLKKDWNIAEAWNIIIASIFAGEVDIENTGVRVYFIINIQDKNVPYFFNAYRNRSGILCIDLRKMFRAFRHYDGCGVALGN